MDCSIDVAKRIVDLITFEKFPPQAACDRVDIEYSKVCNKSLGNICIDSHGRWGIGIVGAAMRWAGIIQIGSHQPVFHYGCAKGEFFEKTFKLDK